MTQPIISVVVLTYNRGPLVEKLVRELLAIEYQPLEVIVVDNHSEQPAGEFLRPYGAAIRLIETEQNLGATGRNLGMAAATGDIVITLDDDIYGLDAAALRHIGEVLSEPSVGAVCFKVVDADGRITNWCHHYPADRYAEQRFITNEITEGAVAFRRSVLQETGLYPASFFISHEGPDLAYRILNRGYDVIYSPRVTVVHGHAAEGRASWRRYYYDTRNLLWLAVRNYSALYGLKWVTIGAGSMLVYALRDGYARYWAKGLWDGLVGIPQAWRERTPPTARVRAMVREIDRHRPGFFAMARKRLFSRGVRI